MKQEFWKHKPVLLTGGTGFVGGWLAQALVDRGAELVCLVRDTGRSVTIPPAAYYVTGDIRDQKLLTRAINEYSVDVVFHLAAQAIVPKANEYPAETMDVNINGTRAVLEAVRTARPNIKVIVASSDKAYGECQTNDQGKHVPYTEETPLLGLDPYSVSKACADRIAQSYLVHNHLNIAVARCGNIYGGGDMNWHRLIPGTIRRIAMGLAPVIYGTGLETRDFFYVQDVVAGYLALAERDGRGPFNFSTGKEFTVCEVIDAISRAMESPYHPVPLGRTQGEISYQVLDWTRARDGLGWKPKYSFEEGLKETIAWYRAYLLDQESV